MQATIKIALVGIEDPVVWRRVVVPGQFTFHQLHLVIQAAMGWRNSHLYSFSEQGLSSLISITSPFDEEPGIDARTVPVSKILLAMYNSGIMGHSRRTLTYIYDYGDHWEHLLDVEQINPEESRKADLLDGAGACPPEDSGGVPGFEDLKQSLRTGAVSEIHGESWVPWLEGMGYQGYGAGVFDLEGVRKGVKRISKANRLEYQ